MTYPQDRFAVKPLAAAMALALWTNVGLAAPTPNQMPGAGRIIAVSSGSVGTSQGNVGTNLTGLVSGGGIGIDGKVVIRWGGTGAPVDGTNPQGFNLGSNATMYFGAIAPNSAVLNIDASGNPSQIYGNLISTAGQIAAVGPLSACGVCAFAPAIFVANANGIVVGAGGRIVAPAGVGLIGADLNNATSIDEFVANNTWAPPGAPALGTSYLSFGSLPSAGATPGLVEIGGAINGDFVTNEPAKYIVVAGNNVHVTNTGNLFGAKVVIDAGVVAQTTKASVGGVTNVAVNRLWNVDTGAEEAWGALGTITPYFVKAGPAGNGNITNEGSISQRGTNSDFIALQGTGNVQSGIDGSTDTLVGLFADNGIFIESMSDTSTVSLFNVVSGYTTNVVLPFLYVNAFATNSGGGPGITPTYADVHIDALTPGMQPSSIATSGAVSLFGRNITIDSTINHKLVSAGGVNTNWDLTVNAKEQLTVAAAIGSGKNVFLTAGTDTLIAGNVRSDTSQDGSGGIFIQGGTGTTTITGDLLPFSEDANVVVKNTLLISGMIAGFEDVLILNAGTGPGNSTTITGDIITDGTVTISQDPSAFASPLTLSGDIQTSGAVVIENRAAAAGNTTKISGNVTSFGSTVSIFHSGLLTGLLETTGTLSGAVVNILTDGNAHIGAIDAGVIVETVGGLDNQIDGPWTATLASINAPLATTLFKPEGTIDSAAINLSGLNFKSVDALGGAFASAADKPAYQFRTNALTVSLTGSINAPIAGNTNWPQNSLDVAPLLTLAPVLVSVSASGGGFQAVNLHVLGSSIFDTGSTTTPFIGVPLTSGGFPAGGLQGNLGSQLIIQADGSLTIVGTPTGSLTGPAVAAQWPGGASFIAGTTLQLLTPFYNAWSVESPAFGGSFWTAPAIALNGYIATSGTAWANFSSEPVTGNPTVYQVRSLGTNAFGFAATDAFVKNDYLQTVVGGFVCTVLGPTTWTVCP